MSQDGYVGPEFNRHGPAGQYIDPATGARIGNLDDSAGWSLDADGNAIRDNDPASPYSQYGSSGSSTRPTIDPDDGDEEMILLLLLS